MRARIAWAVAGLTLVAVVLDTVFTAAHRPLLSEATWADHGWPLVPLASAGCSLMGALIITRYPWQPLGWLLCAAGLSAVTLAGEAYGAWVLDGHGPGSPSRGHVSGWAASLLGWPAFTAMIMVFLISPHGRLLSPRWRWAVLVTVAGLVLRTLGTLTIRPGEFVKLGDAGHRPVTQPLLTVGWILVAAGLIASAASLLLRLRRARDDVRRQLLWIASSAAFLASGVVVILLVPRLQGGGMTWLAALPLHAAQLVFPLCVAVAVLRHRLFEIDLIVNRALLLALATGLVGIGYVLVVVVVGGAVGGGAGGFWPSLLATAAVALAFQPLRRRVVRVADRLAFGHAAAPYQALADFSRRLGDSPDPSALLPAVADATARAVNAAQTTVRLHVEGGADRTALWPALAADAREAPGIEIPVVHGGQRLGDIVVRMPIGRALRARDVALLGDLAEQAGLAFRNARLSAELSGQVEQLARRTSELAQSRRRLITAGDAERSRLERSIATQVVLHLAPLPRRLRRLSRLDSSGAPVALDAAQLGPLIASSNAALEALRDITRSVFPAQLTRSGLPAAVASLLSRDEGTGRLVVEDSAAGRRFGPRVEAAAYYCVVEAVRHLGDPLDVALAVSGDQVNVIVSGSERAGLPLSHMRDRVEAAGGSVTTAVQHRHTVVDIRLPASIAGALTAG